MDKYEFNIKVEQIKKLTSKGDYDTAMKIADTIDWRRVRNANLLSLIAEVYEKNDEFQEAKEILLLAFERAPIGKRLLYKLAELALREGNTKEAEDYYREFCELAPDDPRQHLLRYLILKEKKAPAEQLIHSLESYTGTELDEKWLYQLAELYSIDGRRDECIKTCDKIMMMFGLGKYVDKAMELKVQFAPLTGYQLDLIENRDKYEEKLRAVEQEFGDTTRRMMQNEYDDDDQEESYLADTNIKMNDADTPYKSAYSATEEAKRPYAGMESGGDAELIAGLHQAEAEERLAQTVSQISVDDYGGTEPASELTKVIPNLKEVIPPHRGASPVWSSSQAALDHEGGDFTNQEAEESSIIVEEAEDASMMDPYEEAEDASVMDPHEGAEDASVMDPYEEAADYTQPEDVSAGEPLPSHPAVMKDVLQQSAVSAEPETEEACMEEETDEKSANLEADAVMHLMIESRTPEKGLEIAVEALKVFHKERGFKNQVIKISGIKLSGKGIFASADKIAGKDLVIEEAGDLTETALHELNEVMMKDRTGMRVILIDNPMQIESMCHINPGLASMFTYLGEDEEHEEIELQTELPVRESSSIPSGHAAHVAHAAAQLPERVNTAESASGEISNRRELRERFDAADETAAASAAMPAQRQPIPHYPASGEAAAEEELELRAFVDYASQYAGDIDCSINGKSMLALYERIEIMEEDGVPLTKANAEDLIEAAADKAEKFSFKKLFTGLFSPKYDKEGLLILREDHFMN